MLYLSILADTVRSCKDLDMKFRKSSGGRVHITYPCCCQNRVFWFPSIDYEESRICSHEKEKRAHDLTHSIAGYDLWSPRFIFEVWRQVLEDVSNSATKKLALAEVHIYLW